MNVNNSVPTTCISDVLRFKQAKGEGSDVTLRTEEVVARAVSTIESLFELIQKQGLNDFLTRYYSRWLHRCARALIK